MATMLTAQRVDAMQLSSTTSCAEYAARSACAAPDSAIPERMTAFWLDKTSACHAYLKHDAPVPTPRPNEALIRVLRAGVCGTDLAMMNNYKPCFEGALGHEFVGRVVRVGGDHNDNKWIGKRVVGEINIPCNDDVYCRVCSRFHRGMGTSAGARDPAILHRNHCPNRHALGIVGRSGAFAEYITLPLANLLAVPDNVFDTEAAFTEPLAAAYRIVEQSIIRRTDRVAVLGDGRLGLLIAEVLAVEKTAHHITLVGKHPEKLALVEHLVDAIIPYHTSADDPTRGFDEMFRERFDVVVECTGTTAGISTAMTIVASHGGRIIMKSTCAVAKSEISSDALALAARKGVQVVGSRCGPFAPALAAIAANRVSVTKFLTASYPLARAGEAMAHAKQRGVLKVQLDLADPRRAG